MIPTLLACDTVVNLAKKNKLPKNIAKKAISVGNITFENFRLAVKNNIPIAFGSDTGISPHGDNWKEFLLMVKYSGMSPFQALQTATINASKVLGLENKIGSLDVGKQADIIGIKGQPDIKINDIENVSFVMKGGRIFKHPN